MKHIYFIKFKNNKNVEKFEFENYEEMFHRLKEFMIRNFTGHIDWMIRE